MSRGTSRHLASLTALILGLTVAIAVPAPPLAAARAASPAAAPSITIDGNSAGRTFDGIGAISGGGGNSRLLADYPDAGRSAILDYLFKPGYGASLQILKIEIGGDTNSTDGAEASHEHSQGVIDCNQGYEWWLAGQAKARNPNIKLYGLAWGAPGWVGGGSNTFFTSNAISYLMDWLGCAKQHGLTIDYLGGWNERGYSATWYENLKSTLAAKGFGATKVVAADSDWSVAGALAANPTFNAAVDVIGVHYPCGYLTSFTSCRNTSDQNQTTAINSGKTLWASENGSEDTDGGAPAVARAINRDYIDGKMTSYINWPLIAALYPNLHFSTDGLAIANQPWSGSYHIGQTAWVSAQTTQFTAPGWRYLDSGSGYLSGGGSFVSLRSTSNGDYSTVIETMDATAAQTPTFTVTGGLSTGTVHVWTTNLRSSNAADYFVHSTDIAPSGGVFTLTLQPGFVYTLTTTSTVPGTSAATGKGTATSPAAASLALPYSDNFESAATTTSPKYFSDMNGAFATVPCSGRSGTCLQQMAPATPVRWTGESYDDPYTFMGDGSWSNYTVSADVNLRQSGTVELLGRVNLQAQNNNGLNAYHLRVSDSGAWSILRSDTSWNFTTLGQGTTTALGTGQWHSIALTLQGSTLTATLDGKTLGSATDSSYTNGQAGLGVVGYQNDQFDNFSVKPGTGTGGHTGPITSGLAGKCVNDSNDSSTRGAPVQIWDCNGGAAQVWTYSNQTLTINGECMDVTGQGTANLTPVEIWDCNGGQNQQWTPGPNGSLISAQSGKCLDDPGSNTTNGTQLIIYTCNGGANQKWTLP